MAEPRAQQAAQPAALHDLSGTSVGRFAVQARLGVGAMGEVYRAEDTKLKRPVALKRIAPHLRTDEHYRQRFLREAEYASRLSDPHIAGVYDVFEEGADTFLVMEYVEGEPLRQRLGRPMPVEDFLPIAVQCATALAAAHERGILHRDIKPENIMLTPAGRVKILDFGIAKRLPRADETASVESRSGAFSGTPAYMAPEVLLEKEADARSDIFSLGVVFYEALAGKHPFRADSFVATSNRILEETPAPLHSLNPDVPAELDQVIAKMLTKDPGERYATAAHLLADLRALQRTFAAVDRTIPLVPRRARQAWSVWGAALIMTLLALAVLKISHRKTSLPPFADHGWVLIGNFENRTGQPVLDGTIQEALTASLEQSRHLNIFPRSRLQQTLQRMKRADAGEIDDALGREICQRENLQALVLGAIARIGDDYPLTVRAVDPEGRSLFNAQEIAGGQRAILPTLDRLAARLREQLGESLEAIQKSSSPLERVTSGSLEAIQYFSEGKRMLYAGKPREARELMQRAVELDPEFAMGYEYLAVVSSHLSHLRETRRYLRRAVELSQHLTERERRKIIGDYHIFVTGDLAQAIDNYRVLLDLYPDDYAARTNLAEAYHRAGQFDQATAEAEMVLRQLDSPGVRNNLGFYHFFAGRIDQAIQVEEKNLSLYPEDKRTLYGLGLFHLVKGDAESAAGYFRRLAATAGSEAGQAHRGLADLYASQGRYRLALEEARKARLVARQASDQPGEVAATLQLASLFLEQNDLQRARQEARSVVRSIEEPEQLALAGSLLFEAGDIAAGRAALRRLETIGTKPWTTGLRAELQLASGNALRALQILQEGSETTVRTSALERHALAYWEARQLPEAAAAYEQILTRRTERAADEVDGPSFHRVVQAYYHLGVVYQELGRALEARNNLERFLSYCQDADSRPRFVSDARVRLQRLARPGPT